MPVALYVYLKEIENQANCDMSSAATSAGLAFLHEASS